MGLPGCEDLKYEIDLRWVGVRWPWFPEWPEPNDEELGEGPNTEGVPEGWVPAGPGTPFEPL